MVTWSIYLNGEPYSCFFSGYSLLGNDQQDAVDVLEKWRQHWHHVNGQECLDALPQGEWSARRYRRTAMDDYGN